MMKRMIRSAVAIVMGLSLTACGSASETTSADSTASAETNTGSGTQAAVDTGSVEKPSSPLRYSLGTSSAGGNYYLVGGGAATIINNTLPDYFVITAEETGGSSANLTMIQAGEAELGISMTSSLAEAWEGEVEWTGGKMDKIRGLAPLYPSYLTMYTLASSDVHTLTDFNDKVIGLGSKGMAMDSVFRASFDEMGIKPSSIFNDGHSATASAVGDGQLDAALIFYYPPASAISELEATQALRFIGLTEEEQAFFTEKYPFYSADVLKAGSYKGMTEDINVISEWNMLVSSSEVSQEYGYIMAKAIFENNPAFIELHKSLMYATPENSLHFNVPLHAGTVQYLKEVGVEVPADLIPEEYTE